jgi:peptidoglycan/LPS O-acetylase OafA/YrhL
MGITICNVLIKVFRRISLSIAKPMTSCKTCPDATPAIPRLEQQPWSAFNGKVKEKSPHRIPSLDGLRAISILMVIFAHATLTNSFPFWLYRRPSAFIEGNLGVRVFFLISGFLITTLLLKEARKSGRINLAAFYLRRCLRILPVYYFYILSLCAIFIFTGINVISNSTYFSALTFTTHWWGAWGNESWPLAHSWSLAIEEQFYLVWPAILVFLGPKRGGRIWVITLLLLAPAFRYAFRDQSIIDHLFITQGDSIAFGCLLALARFNREAQLLRFFQYHPGFGRIAAVLLIHTKSFLFIFHFYPGWLEPWFITFLPTLQCMAITYLIGSFVMVQHGFSYQFLNLIPMQWVGRLSYSLYIWQQLVLIPKDFPVFPKTWPMAMWITRFPQNIVVVFALGMASYYLLERPFLALKNRIEKVPTGDLAQEKAKDLQTKEG